MNRYDRKILLPYLMDIYVLEQRKDYLEREIQETEDEKMKESFNNQLVQLAEILNETYSVNIIPSICRNLYGAGYLYNYFATSESTNLTKVIQNFTLDKIEEKGRIAIQNQKEFIFRQYETIAKQEELLGNYEKYSQEILNQLASVADAEEKKETYMEMMKAHIDVGAYLTVSTHFNRK